MIEDLIKLYNRDLNRLKGEIEAFGEESNLWRTTGEVKNSAGNLCLHLVGNLRTYIGKNLGEVTYIRDREAEFNLRGVSRQKLIDLVEETNQIVVSTLQNLGESKLMENHPEETLGYPMTNQFFLMHLLAHLSYHLGQINYLRRILD